MNPFVRFFLNIRFRSQLLLSYGIVVLIPIVTWVIYSFHQTNSVIVEQAKTNFQNIYMITGSNMEQKLKKIENAFQLITQDTTMVQIINGQYANNYDKYYDLNYKFDPMINALLLMNAEIKEVRIFTNGDIKNTRNNFIDIDDANHLSPYLSAVGAINLTWIFENGKLYVVKKVLSLEDFNRSAIVSLEINPAYIFKNNVSSGFQNYGMLVTDNNHKIVYKENHTHDSEIDSGDNAAEIMDAIRKNERLILLDQKTYPDSWNFYMYLDMSSQASPFNGAFQSTLFIILFSSILIIIAILLLSRTFVRRITKLNRLISNVVAGGFETNIQSNFKDEIGEITNSFGVMVKQTKRLIEEVHSSHTQQRESEIKALQSQINPHFLYNTLSAINWQAIKNGNHDISKIATSLSSFYRLILNKGDMVTTVQNELENIRAYLDIQLSIRDHAFHILYDIDDPILEYNMPSIILQPIVENAIEHGLLQKSNFEEGILIIKAYESGNDIVFEVTDNGEGMSDETIEDVLGKSEKGYGIKNVDNRLKLFFDQQYGLSYRRIQPHGTKAEIKIPKYVHF